MSTQTIRVDLHVHSCFSRDSLSKLEDIVLACRRAGIDKIGLTDHDTIRGALALRELAPDLVIVGQEIKTTHGELIAYFVQEEIPSRLKPEDAIRYLREQGAVVGVSHPLDRIRREAMGMHALLRIIDQIDFLETYNARVILPADNRAATRLAMEHGLLATAGSDAHHVGHIGRAYVEMKPFTDPASFLAGLREGRIHGRPSGPLVHLVSTYAKLRRRVERVVQRVS